MGQCFVILPWNAVHYRQGSTDRKVCLLTVRESLITGSDEPGGLWTEYLDMESGNWTQGPNYPFGEGDESLDPR